MPYTPPTSRPPPPVLWRRFPHPRLVWLSAAIVAAQMAPLEGQTNPGPDPRRAPTKPAQRIISLAPSLTESLFAIGAGPSIVANTSQCNYPAAAQALPKVGGMTQQTLQLERIVAMKPDLVLSVGSGQEPVVARLKELGVDVRIVRAESLSEVVASLGELGRLTGFDEEAARLVSAFEDRIDQVRRKVDDLRPEERPRVFYEVWDRPLMTAGTSFPAQLIELAGGVNVFADLAQAYPQVSPEVVVERDPEVIVGPMFHGRRLALEDIDQRPGWSGVSAIRSGRVYVLDGDSVSRPGPRLIGVLEEFARLLHPDRFPPPGTAKR